MQSYITPWRILAFVLILLARPTFAADVWSNPAFSTDPATLCKAAESVKAEKQTDVTLLLNEVHFDYDEAGRLSWTRHLIYRVETQRGVENWAETSGRWQAWHQSKPEIKARVITEDGVEHWLDPKTLNDVPVHQSAPDIYSDQRRFGGPLPAVAPGAIVEEQVTVRDTAPLFSAGTVHRWSLAWSVPVKKTHFVIAYPDSLPLHYKVHLLPDASVEKSSQNGRVTLTLDQGPLPAYTDRWNYTPPDVVVYPEFEFSTGTSWNQVAAGYSRLADPKMRTSDVRDLLAGVDVNSGSRDEIIRRIVAALHKNVRYTGVEFGESSLIPQFPSETLKRKYGDCKDKATLLATMLRAAGIPAYLALLDVGPGQDVNRNLPGMGMFDHAIVYVPASGADPDLWIDATARYSEVGTLPWMDYGRWALVVNKKTEALKQIPELTSAENVHREVREFTLADYGMASIVETDSANGPGDASLREYYSQDNKQVREQSESYVKSMYLADSLISLDHNDLADLSKPAKIKFVTKGKRGNTGLTTAAAAIRVEGLFDRLPQYFRTKAPERSDEDADDHKERTVDWQITPFATEWDYKVMAPPGFKLRALPPGKDEKVGTIRFTQKYSANPEGTVIQAVLRVEDSTPRMTVRQAEDLRDAVVKARNEDPVFISFENEGYTLIAAGKIKEGLAEYERIAAEHPTEALQKVRLAQALLDVGLGQQARKVAREATTLDPKSALAFSTLGAVLKHDLIGRLLKKGMDYDGAVAAYRKAVELDPKDKETLANLALLLEYDADGMRYSENAKLKDAVAVIRELKKLDEDYASKYENNILYDLWYAHDYQGVLDEAATLPATDVRRGLILAATAVQQGAPAALKKSLEVTLDNDSRRKALMTAGAVLVRVRKYQEGAAMLAEGARGQANESQIARSVTIFKNTKPYEDVSIDPSDPRNVVQQLYARMLSGKLTLKGFISVAYFDPLAKDDSMDEKDFNQMMSNLKAEMGSSGLPLVTIADMVVSNMKYTVEGDDATGYKIILESPGAPPRNIYVVRQDGQYKIVGFSVSNSAVPVGLASLALQAIDKGNLAVARVWLDRARDEIHISRGDDPLSGQLFPYFWTKGQEADTSTARTAALILLRPNELKGANLAALIRARRSAKSELERARMNLHLAYAYVTQQNWKKLLPVTRELIKAFPDSLRAANLAALAYGELKRFDDWQAWVQGRMHEHPDEMEYVRLSAQMADYRGDFRKAREILKTIIDKGRASPEDLNHYAWDALFLSDPIEQETIDIGQRGVDLTGGNSFPVLHTLACVDAQAGRTGQARELLLKAMESNHLEEPNTEVWFGFALIAEQYGVPASAEEMFKRVEKPKFRVPNETYALAQQHLAALRKAAVKQSKTAGP